MSTTPITPGHAFVVPNEGIPIDLESLYDMFEQPYDMTDEDWEKELVNVVRRYIELGIKFTPSAVDTGIDPTETHIFKTNGIKVVNPTKFILSDRHA
jgi:hypothetical protein